MLLTSPMQVSGCLYGWLRGSEVRKSGHTEVLEAFANKFKIQSDDLFQVLDLMASGMQHPNVLVREEVVNTCIMVSVLMQRYCR